MKTANGIGIKDVQAVYAGPEGRLWELIMGEQIHIGGLTSSMDLADAAGIGVGMRGVDLCCCTGAGVRFLLRFRGAGHMTGVDATEAMVELGRRRSAEDGSGDRTEFVLSDVCSSGLPSGAFDFVWGEDAWCYVEDKERLIAEAARIVKPGGLIAFTDWVEGTPALTDAEAERFQRFMKFPNLQNMDGYCDSLERHGCSVVAARDTGRYHSCIELYIQMLTQQLTYDALRIVGFNKDLLAGLAEEMNFVRILAAEGKVIQSLIVARRESNGHGA